MQRGGGRRTDKRAPITIFCEQEHTRTGGILHASRQFVTWFHFGLRVAIYEVGEELGYSLTLD